MNDRDIQQIAMYWDFENIHISVYEEEYGPRTYYQRERQPALVDIDTIMDFASTLGSVCVNRAYCNWAYLDRYAEALGSHAIQLMQMWPRGGNGKNGADIQMCVDIMEDLQRLSHVDTFVIVSGDSDFIGVLSKLKQYGKRVIGIGVQGATHRLMIEVCDEFKFYDSLLSSNKGGRPDERGASGLDKAGAKRLLADAMQRLTSQLGVESVKQVSIKPVMQRLYSAFDERAFGFGNFSGFLDACDDVVEISIAGDGSERLIKLIDSQSEDLTQELEHARKLLIAGMTFLSRRSQPIAMAALKPMLKKLDPEFSETRIRALTFLAFLQKFPDIVAIEGSADRRTLKLVCDQDEGGYTLPQTPSVALKTPFLVPSNDILEAANVFHWEVLRKEPASDWSEYYEKLSRHLDGNGLNYEEQALKAVQSILRGAKALRPKTDNMGITLKLEFVNEQNFRDHIADFIARERAQTSGQIEER